MNQETDKLILIVEDELYFQEALQIYLKKIGFKDLIVANNFDKAVSLFKTYQPDLVLIDVELGEGKSGIDLAETFNTYFQVPIVFITANYNSDVYEEAKKVNPIAFINKEISELKLKQVIELGLLHSNRKDSLLIQHKVETIHEDIFIKIGNVLKKFFLADIDWFGVDGKYAYAKTRGKNFPLSLSLKDLEERLGQKLFIRVHQSYMVNIKKIESVNPVKNIIIVSGESLPIGRSFKKNLLKRIQYF